MSHGRQGEAPPAGEATKQLPSPAPGGIVLRMMRLPEQHRLLWVPWVTVALMGCSRDTVEPPEPV